MKKKLLSVLVAGAMSLSLLVACGQSNGGESGAKASEANKTEESGSASGSEGSGSLAEQAIAERKASGEMPTVVISTFTWTGRPAGADRVQELLSEYAQEKLGCKIELEIMDYSSYSQSLTLMLSSGEHVDIFNTLGVGYPNVISKGYALEIDDLLKDYGQGITSTIDADYINACKVGGITYGVPQKRDIASGKGRYVVPTRFLDEIGYDWKSKVDAKGETIECSIEDVDALFAQLKEKYPEMSMLWPNRTTALGNSILFDPVGNDNFGVLMDYENSLEVTNLFETEEFLNTCKMFYKWNQAGYLPKDILTDTTTPQENMKAGTAISTLANWKPGAKLEQENQIGESIVYFKVLGDFTSSGAVTTMNWCINSGTENEVAAMQVLDMLYTDPKAATLLAFGEEGVDYVVGDDGFVTYPEGVTASTVEYSSLVWLNPNQNITGVWKGNPADVYEATDEFNKNAPKSKALGFSFDNSEVMAEYTALTNVFDEYIYQVMFGFVEPEAGIAQMNEKLYDAGLEKYMQAKQEALNKWAEENGIK